MSLAERSHHIRDQAERDEADQRDEFDRLIVFTIARLGFVKLSELLPAFWAIAPGMAPETVHDSLNNLLQAGRLKLSPAGCYYVP